MAQSKRKGMSREEAGRKGGKATHACRGRECNSNNNNKSKSSSSHSKSSNNNNSWF